MGALKSAEILIKNGSISSDCVLMVDEMYLKKYHNIMVAITLEKTVVESCIKV